jgi:hypothetical protein
MSLHDVFIVLRMITCIVLIALTVYAVKTKNTLPAFVTLGVSSFFDLMASLTA